MAKKNISAGRKDDVAYVRRSTLILSVVVAVLFGLYMGTLISGFDEYAKPVGNSGSAPVQQAEQSDEITKAIEATVSDPNSVQAWIRLGNLYYGSNKPSDSVLAYTRALELNPNNPDVLTDRGTMYRKLGKFDLALDSYAKASELNPMHKNSYFNAGIVLYYDLNRKAEAIAKWEQLLSIDPNYKGPNGMSLKEIIEGARP